MANLRIAVQETALPGDTAEQKYSFAAECGYEGIEISFRDLTERLADVRKALRSVGLPASTVCGSGAHDLVVADKEERQKRVEAVRKMLEAASELEATGFILVPIRRPSRLSDLSPLFTSDQLEQKLFAAVVADLAEYAHKLGTLILIEPLNRYETNLVKTIEQGIEICKLVDSPGLRVMGDLFHMGIEEAHPVESIDLAGEYLRHIHLADSNRQQPGKGHTDFVSQFTALRRINYNGFMALECLYTGPDGKPTTTGPERLAVLKETADFLRTRLNKSEEQAETTLRM